MALTHQNYHTLENRYLTNSRIGDWLKCKRFFFERHISGQRPGMVITDALKIGKAVDIFISQGEEEFRKQFIAVSRRNIKNPPINVIELTEKQYEDVIGMSQVILNQPAYKDLADYDKQRIITLDMPIGEHFCGLAGIPDFMRIEGDTCYLVDEKTAWDTDDRKYYYKCRDFGYFRQFAVMTIILRQTNPEIKNFIYRHLVIEKDKDSIFQPAVFTLANEQIEAEIDVINKHIIPDISKEKDFKPKEVNWKDAILIGAMDEEI